ncbi:MAG TPA: MFS transporter [Terriglobales bacterium]|nr:MFS transporter [Terriglobales bacterium]
MSGKTSFGGAVSAGGAAVAVAVSPQRVSERIWMVVLVSGFLGLMVDGMDLMFLSYSLPSLMKDLHISKVQAGSLASYSLLGMALGGFFGGWAADRFGRVRTVVWTILVFSIGTSVLGLTHSYWQFAFVRFISALGLGAEYVVCNTLMSEYVPTGRRTTVLGTLQAGWSVGYVVATLLAGAIIPKFGWRWLFATALVPVALAIFVRRVVPEPPGWTKAAAERKQAIAQGKTLAKRKSQWKAVLADPACRRIFVLWTLTSCFLQFGYYGVNNWLPTYVVNELKFNFTKMTGYLVGTYVAMIFGKIIAGYLADVFGRRWMYVFGGLSTAVFLPVIVRLHSPGNIIVLLTVFGFFYGIPYGVNATYMTESFQTHIRGTAVGGAYNVGRVGAAIAPTVIGLIATRYSIGLGLIVMGGAYFLTGIIPALFIKEKLYDPQAAA